MYDPEALIGKSLGQYRIISYLAQGGMTDVYVAEHERLGRQAALKVLMPQFVRDVEFVSRFDREARAVATLHHPNIVQVFDTDVTADGYHYLAMEYVTGGSLEDLLRTTAERRESFTAELALAIARQMADALATAHEAGIVHRDLKPSNILLRADGQAVLADLGIAMLPNSAKVTRENVLVGTPQYMSPEQARGEKLDGRSDIYSLGIILYEMLAGRRPFESDQAWTIVHKQIYEQPEPLTGLRPGLHRETYRLVARCLEKDAASRFQTATELRAVFDDALAKEGGKAVITESGAWSWQPLKTGRLFTNRLTTLASSKKRRRALAILGAVLLIPVVAAIVLWATWIPREPSVIAQTTLTATSTTRRSTETATALPATKTLAPVFAGVGEPEPARAITLLWPADGAQLAKEEEIDFWWMWPAALEQEELFLVFISGSPEVRLEGQTTAVEEWYRFSVPPGALSDWSGQVTWSVRLQDRASSEIVTESDARVLVLLDITATATPTPTATGTSTRPPTRTPTRPAPTPTATPTAPATSTITPIPPEADTATPIPVESDTDTPTPIPPLRDTDTPTPPTPPSPPPPTPPTPPTGYPYPPQP